MALDLTILLDQYLEALQAYLATATDVHDRNHCFARLSAADAMRTEIVNINFGRAAGILNEENRIMGWNAFYGEGSDAVNHSFCSFSDALQAARLADRPYAGFGH